MSMRAPWSPVFPAALACVMLAVPVWPVTAAGVSCNPPVRLDVDNAPLSETLAKLAATHEFALAFPDSVDRAVTLHEELPLDELLARLTSGTSTSYIYADGADCTGHRIVKLVVYPVGEQGEVIRGAGSATGRAHVPSRDQDYIYVEDMDSYVEEVILKKRRPELFRLTPEQRVQFRLSRRRLKKGLEQKMKSGELEHAQPGVEKKAATTDKTTEDGS